MTRHIEHLRIELKPFIYGDGLMELDVELLIEKPMVKPERMNYVITIPPDLLESEFDYFFNKAREGIKQALRSKA